MAIASAPTPTEFRQLLAVSPPSVSRPTDRQWQGQLTGQDLIGWRGRMRLSQADLAHHLHVDVTTVQRWEYGQRTIPPFLYLALDTLQLDLT